MVLNNIVYVMLSPAEIFWINGLLSPISLRAFLSVGLATASWAKDKFAVKDASVITANRKTEFIDNKQSWYVITVLINTFHCKLQLTYF
jgi:hypothetical protein